MRKKGPTIKEIAREIGVTSHALMIRCREEGIFAQNSITRIEPALVPRIKAWYDSSDATTEPPDATSESIGPVAGECGADTPQPSDP